MSIVKSAVSNRRKKKSYTKEDNHLCQHRGCKKQQYERSHFCDFHKDEYFYIDLAYKVNVTGTSIPLHNVYKKTRREKRGIMELYYLEESKKKMDTILLSTPSISKCDKLCVKNGRRIICNSAILHTGSLCPYHLKSKLLKEMRYKEYLAQKYNYDYNYDDISNINHTIPKDVRTKCFELLLNEDVRKVLQSSCRYEHISGARCFMIVDNFTHIGYCSKHLSSSQSILSILKRHKFLNSDVLMKELREIVVSFI